MNAQDLLKSLKNDDIDKDFEERKEELARELILNILRNPNIKPKDGFEEEAFLILDLGPFELAGIIKFGDIKSKRVACEEWIKKDYGFLRGWYSMNKDNIPVEFISYMRKQIIIY